ncbi:MAG: DUF2752 domain-containing protein [Acidobacteria bacterium]|nr:DUF2752 domain-containing protein [Acidobacteriota bacterium]
MTETHLPSVPRIYAISPLPQRLSVLHRAVALAVSMGCLAVLVTAVMIRPNPRGVESHRQLGLAECQFLRVGGIPCPSCGMTTSFTWFVRGNLAASLWIQPMGTALAAGAALTFWAGLYIAATAKPVHRLMRGTPGSYYVLIPLGFGIAAWAWKIFIHLRGIDGWG